MSDLPDSLRAHAFHGMQIYEMFSPTKKVMEEAAERIKALEQELAASDHHRVYLLKICDDLKRERDEARQYAEQHRRTVKAWTDKDVEPLPWNAATEEQNARS